MYTIMSLAVPFWPSSVLRALSPVAFVDNVLYAPEASAVADEVTLTTTL